MRFDTGWALMSPDVIRLDPEPTAAAEPRTEDKTAAGGILSPRISRVAPRVMGVTGAGAAALCDLVTEHGAAEAADDRSAAAM